jgi:hypothetical protein
MDENLEMRARALCAADIDSAEPPVQDRQGAIDRYWIVVATEIAGGNTGFEMPADFELRAQEFRWLSKVPN